MNNIACPNCNNELSNAQKFCDVCGQKNSFHRFTVGHVTHEFFHAFTHADSGIIFLVKELALNPGRVASEFVSGKIKKYFSPFTFMLLCVGFFVLMNNVLKTYPDPPKPDPKILQVIPTPEARQKYIRLIERSANGTKAMNKHANIITVIAMPLYAFIMWLFFRKRKRNFAEILIAMVFYTAFASLATTVLFNPILAYYKGTPAYIYIFLINALLQSFYYTWGLKTFFNYRSAAGYFKIWPVMILTYVIWIVLTLLVFFIYVYGSQTGKVIAALWNAYFLK
ncbi:MAG: DUF3667 domain-containing protein [Ferruginibacter sp.]